MPRTRLTTPFALCCALFFIGASCKPKGQSQGDPSVTECNAPSPRVPLRLLTRAEYDNTVGDLLGDTSKPARDFPREPLAEGFDNDGNLNQVTDESAARYLEAAEAIAAATVSTRKDRLYTCATKDTVCAKAFIDTVGRRLFRRTLSADERQFFFSTFFSSPASDFDTAVELTLQAMLQSPQFLYRFEEGVAPTADAGWRTPIEGAELASRLSYFLWASAPDDALLDAAESGELADPDALLAQASRLLADPKGVRAKGRFFNLWLRLDDIGGLEKSTGAYPAFTPALAAAWRSSIDLFISDVMSNEGTLKALLTSNAMFVNNTMSMYSPNTSPTFSKVMMPPAERTGLLTQPGLLARLASPDQSSPIRRGIFVLDKLMCQTPPPPPPTVNVTPPAVDQGGTTRERFSQHSQDPSCRGCHGFIDPLGFGFEHFDGLGAWRLKDNGKDVDASGEIVAAREQALLGTFNGANELMQKLAASRQVHDCVSNEWLRFAMGRGLGDGDDCSLAQVQDEFSKSGGRFDDLLLAIVRSDTFRTRPIEAASP